MPLSPALLNKIRYNVLFETADESILKKLFDNLEEVQVRDGDIIFEDSSNGGCLYLLISGSVKICKTSKNGDEAILAILHAGDFFGELEMIDGHPRSARAVAIAECKLACLYQKEFNALLQKDHNFTLNLLKMLSLRLRTSDQMVMLHSERHVAALQHQIDKMHKLIEASKKVNSSLDTDKLLSVILQTATETVRADRGTVYIIDELKGELWSRVLQGDAMVEIRLPIGKGIAGYVAATGETINIPDAYADARFNPDFDKRTGYKTKTILCMGMRNRENKIIGVFQLLNKAHGAFTEDDEEYLDALSIHASIAIENAQLAQEMVSNERLSAVGKMASTIIHDIKNPMGTLRVYAQVMKKKAGDEEVGKLADEMIRQVDRFVNMTQEILDFSRGVSSMNIQESEFGELMEMVLMFIEKDLTKRNVKIIKNIGFTGKVMADQDKLMRVFYNIAGNAADAMPEGGTLKVNTFEKDGRVVIEFIDSGTGMPPEVKAKIFEPFVTYGKKHGTGLGMAIVKKIIDDHKGSIEIESEMGKGTTIRLFLPIMQATPATEEKPA
jgi:signal transduction histidine kinase/CRP-like cAMP-binding protein